MAASITIARAIKCAMRFLVAEGFKVLRFWNNEVLQRLDGVLEVVRLALLEVDL